MYIIPDEYFEVFDDPELNDYLEEMRGCVKEKEIEGFDEIIIKFEYTVLEKILEKIDKKIATPNCNVTQTLNVKWLYIKYKTNVKPNFRVGLLIFIKSSYCLLYNLFTKNLHNYIWQFVKVLV